MITAHVCNFRTGDHVLLLLKQEMYILKDLYNALHVCSLLKSAQECTRQSIHVAPDSTGAFKSWIASTYPRFTVLSCNARKLFRIWFRLVVKERVNCAAKHLERHIASCTHLKHREDSFVLVLKNLRTCGIFQNFLILLWGGRKIQQKIRLSRTV